jgi:two-component system, cell cycle sensor histidine kinase and response regulator CckA
MPIDPKVRYKSQSQADVEYRNRVLRIAKGLSATLGADFFNSVVKHLVTAFRADCGYIAELIGESPGRMRVLSFYQRRRKSQNVEQKGSGTASGQVLTDGWFACSKDASVVFPEDALLHTMQAEGYAGIRLSSSEGQAIGVLAVVSKTPLTDIQLVKAVLSAFAPRVAAELERKRLDDVHRENEERYQAFISRNPDAMWRIEFPEPIPLNVPEDEQVELIYRLGYLAECNDALARYFGEETAEGLIGYPFETVASRVNSNAREELREAVRSRFRTATVEARPLDQDGRYLYRLRSQFGIVENGALKRIWGTTRDVTELRRTELSLINSERLFRDVLEGIQLPAVMLDPTGAVTFCNDYLLRLMNCSREELFILNWMRKVVPAEETQIWNLMLTRDRESDHKITHFKGVVLATNGVRSEILWDAVVLYGENGKATGLVAIGRDITYQKVLELDTLQAQKLASMGRVAVSIANRFDNYSKVILGHVSELIGKIAQDDPAYASLSAIKESAGLCGELTAQLRTFGGKQQLKPKSIDLSDIVANEEGFIRSLLGGKIILILNLASPVWRVYADPTQIQRALAILVRNASEAMPLGGELTIATSNLVIGVADTSYPGLAPGSYVRLSVTDNGVGMAGEIRARLFEPFATTKCAGIGLGLAAAYGIVTQSAGHISVRSDTSKGTTLDILLPAAVLTPQIVTPQIATP